MFAANNRTLKYMKQKSTKKEMYKYINREAFNTHFAVIYRTSRHKTRKYIEE